MNSQQALSLMTSKIVQQIQEYPMILAFAINALVLTSMKTYAQQYPPSVLMETPPDIYLVIDDLGL